MALVPADDGRDSSCHGYTVRDYDNRIIQFQYNRSGLDPKWQVHTGSQYGAQFVDVNVALQTWL